MTKSPISDNCYNLTNQLSKKLKAIKHYDRIIKDAKKCDDEECATILKKIQADDKRHAEMLRNHIEKLTKQRKFK